MKTSQIAIIILNIWTASSAKSETTKFLLVLVWAAIWIFCEFVGA